MSKSAQLYGKFQKPARRCDESFSRRVPVSGTFLKFSLATIEFFVETFCLNLKQSICRAHLTDHGHQNQRNSLFSFLLKAFLAHSTREQRYSFHLTSL